MGLQSIDIFGFKSGVEKNRKPLWLAQDAFSSLENAYVWREELRKREGIQLIGRYRRVFTAVSIGNSGASPWSVNILSTKGVKGTITGITNANPGAVTTLNDHNLTTGDLVVFSDIAGMTQLNGQTVTITSTGANTFTIGITTVPYGVYTTGGVWSLSTEPNAELDPGSVVIVIGAITLTDQGNGLLTSVTAGNSGYVDYLSGLVVLTHTAGAGAASTASFAYYTGLPAMGIIQREIAGINDEQNIWFDTKYAYIHDGADFQEFLPAEAATWNGTNSDFFWGTNYRGSDAQTRLYFVTNFVASAGSPMRYTDAATWKTFQPILGGTTQTDILTQSLAAGVASYGPAFLTKLPVVEGSVVITVADNAGVEADIIFRDTPMDGTLVSSGLNTGTIVYATGQIDLTFNPVLPGTLGTTTYTVTAVYSQGGTLLFSARILIPYYGRLLALNTWEGTEVGSAVNLYNRCRFSQIGNPVQQDAWRSDTFGKGGFIDAPVNEDIISATFYKNTLIVSFERSTWRLQYLGEYGLPFIWERISSDFGSESTFSSVLFDNGVLTVGDKAITGSSAGDVQRIDLSIPDTVYDFRNADNGVKRVHGIRDFKKELVYWCYPEFSDLYQNQFYPNKSLVYNYRNNTFAFFRNNVTCFGAFQYPASITWDRLDVFWDNYNVLWDGQAQSKLPLVASANQQGFAHFYGYADAETGADSTIDAMDQESLSVTGVTVGSTVVLTIKDHNLQTDEFIYLTGLNYVNTTSPATAGSTTLNNQIYRVQFVDKDSVRLFKYDPQAKDFYENFTVTNSGTYVGGGVVALFPNIHIETKDFNPLKESLGQNIKTSYIDFLFDASAPSPINVKLRMNATSNADGERSVNSAGNLIVGNTNVESANSKAGWVFAVSLTNPCVVESKNHGLLDGDEISFDDIVGTVELNGNQYTVTFISTDTFSIGVDGTAFTAYQFGGYWIQTKQQYYTLSSQYAWHRFFATAFGQFFSVVLSYDAEQMSNISTHRQNFVLNAMKIWYRSGGKNIFGK